MRLPVAAFAAILLLHGPGAADDRLTAEEVVEFFTRGGGAAGGAAAGLRTRGVDGGRLRSVHVGPTGFGGDAETAAAEAADPQAPGALDLLVTFDLDSARLTEEARRNLDAFIQALAHPALTGLRFAVEGHTDATGPAAHNQALSERRAAAVVDYLAAHGVENARLNAQGFGETRPRTANPDAPANRRVETRRLP